MTKEEILAMEEGRQLDAMIAHEIFGFEVEWDYPPWDIDDRLPKQPFLKSEPRICLGPMAHPVANTIFNYSTDISAAWLVVEKMFEDGYREQQFTRCHRTGVWEAKFGIVDAGFAESFSLPEAICRAALLAKLEEKK